MPAEIPAIKLQAVVISLYPDTNTACEGICPGNMYPKDRGVILVEQTLSEENSVALNQRAIEVGKEIQVEFIYSCRPAKIRMIPASAAGDRGQGNSSGISAAPTFAKPIPRENGYFLYEFVNTLVENKMESILSGLEVGSRFTTTIHYSPPMISIGEYDVIY